MLLRSLQHLTDDELIGRIAALDGTERRAAADLVAHLAEMEARGLHLALGYSSLYTYCRTALHLSEHESYNRMEAARLSLRFPVVLAMLAHGVVHLTAVRLLAPHLEGEDHMALLGGAMHKTKDEVKELLARWFPKEDVKTSIRRVSVTAAPGRSAASVPGAARESSVGNGGAAPGSAPGSASPAPGDGAVPDSAPPAAASSPATSAPAASSPATSSPAHRRRASIDPLSADAYAVRLTARRATVERLRRAQELLSHAVPDGDVDEILYRALGELIESIGRGTAGEVRRPARETGKASRHIPAAVERIVRQRDQDRCAFIGRNGTRCEERRFLELHHVKPWIVGGDPTPENIELRCRAHNQYEARVYFAPIRAAMECGASAEAWAELVPERVDAGAAPHAASG